MCSKKKFSLGYVAKARWPFEWIDASRLPPLSFLARSVDLMVVDGAKRNGEFIADL
jgi:hypothetical protein